MQIEEHIDIIDENDKYLTTVIKTVPGICNLIFPYVHALATDLETSMYQTVLYKTILDRVYLDNFRDDKTVNSFFNLIEKTYTHYSKKYPANMKYLKILMNKYKIVTNFSLEELETMEQFDLKVLNQYIYDEENDRDVLVNTYPFLVEILPYIYNDMLTQYDLYDCILLNDFSIHFLKELEKRKLIDKEDEVGKSIISEFKESDYFLNENIDNYTDIKVELLKSLSYKVETKTNVFNDPTLLSNYIFSYFLKNKVKDFFELLNQIFSSFKNEESFNYDSIIHALRYKLTLEGYINIAKCIGNMKDTHQEEAFVNLLFIKLYEIYDTEEYHMLFDDGDDRSRGLDL